METSLIGTVFPNADWQKPANVPSAIPASRASIGSADFRQKTPLFSLRQAPEGFSLIELLLSFAVIALILVMMFSITDTTSRMWKGTTEKMQAFEESRAAFDRITSLLAQATLNPYWDYDDPQNPTKYERISELQFLSLPMAQIGKDAVQYPTHGLFFQAPTGKVTDKTIFGQMPLLLNAYGYFIEYGPDDRPAFLSGSDSHSTSVSARNRFRLKEWRVPSESWLLYGKTSGTNGKSYLGATSYDWINLANPAAKALAENVVAFVVYPKNPVSVSGSSSPLAEADTFIYNSRNSSTTAVGISQKHQLPPEVEVIMVAIDETSASRVWNNTATAPDLTSGLFLKPAKLGEDLDQLTGPQGTLTQKHIKFIILRSTVKIRGARWTNNLLP